MTSPKTLQFYIEPSLFEYPSLYGSRWDVLEHMFCVNGNGVDLNEEGYIEGVNHEQHPSNIPNLEEYARARERTIAGSRTNPAFIETMVQESLLWQERSMIDTPVKSLIYPWSTSEKFQPFRKFVNCKCPDLADQVRIFVDGLDRVNAEEHVDLRYQQFYKNMPRLYARVKENGEYDRVVRDFNVWKQHTGMIRALFKI